MSTVLDMANKTMSNRLHCQTVCLLFSVTVCVRKINLCDE